MAQAYPQTVLQNTLRAFTQTDEVPANGTDLVKEWLSVLKSTDGAETLHQHLTDLYDELLNRTPDTNRVKELLNTIANQTGAVSRTMNSKDADDVSQLADVLRAFATDLGRVSENDRLSRNQPDTTPVYANPGDHLQALLTTSQETLAGGPASTAPDQSVALLEEWISVAQSDPSAQWIEAPLRELIDALAKGDLRNTERLMRDLAGIAQEYATNSPDAPFSKGLTNLATALISFAGPLS